MYFNINELVERELNDICEMIKSIESRYKGRIAPGTGALSEREEQEEEAFLKVRYTKDGVIYDKRMTKNGKRITVRLGGADNKEVILIKLFIYMKSMVLLRKQLGRIIIMVLMEY